MTNVLAQPPPVHSDTSRTDASYLPNRSPDSLRFQAGSSATAHSNAACQGPRAIVALLEESESKANKIEIQNIHTILAYQKNALKHCTNMLNCTRCNPPSDHMMLLAIVCRKLVSSMEEVVHIFIQRKTSQPTDDNEDDSRQICGKLFFGDYMVDSEVEWAPMVRILIMVLLKGTLRMLNHLKRIARTSLRETQMLMLQAIEDKIGKMALSLQHPLLAE